VTTLPTSAALWSKVILATCGSLCMPNAFADYGEPVLRITCDQSSGLFEVEPLKIWNEELEGLTPLLEGSNGRLRTGAVTTLGGPWPRTEIMETCALGKRVLTVVLKLAGSSIEISDGPSKVARFQIGYVWRNYGYVYRVRFTRQRGWQETCGLIDSDRIWVRLNAKRTTTDCMTAP
jgi:hypothetical protein